MMGLSSLQVLTGDDSSQRVLMVVLDSDGNSTSFVYSGKVETSIMSDNEGGLCIQVVVEPVRKPDPVEPTGPPNAPRR